MTSFISQRWVRFVKSLLPFLLAGPALGGLMAFIGVTLTLVLPDLWADPGNAYGHDRAREFFGTFALVMIFAYPVGLLPALAAGVAQFFVRHRRPAFAQGRVWAVSLVAFGTMGVEQYLLLDLSSPWLLPAVAFASAALVSMQASRSARIRPVHRSR